MGTKDLIEILQNKYPAIAGSIQSSIVGEEEVGELKFKNPRYTLWFTAENISFVVGINFNHSHFDSEDYEINLEDALGRIDDIIGDRIVAIGKRDVESDYLITVMEKEEGI